MFTSKSQFYNNSETEQKPNQVVDVSDWSIGDLSPYREGTRDKSLVVSPVAINSNYPFILPEHSYLLKKSYRVEKTGNILHYQFWNEIIAYKLGRALGVKVPPAFVARYNKAGNESFYGSLIEWFYNYDDGVKDNVKRGSEIIIWYIAGYDVEKGEAHNLQTVMKIFEDEQVQDWLKDLTEMLTLDAIIGNTDRHQDNWQIIDYALAQKRLLSPAFDNGTSLCYNIREEQVDKWLGNDWKNKQASQIKNGYHHMKWQLYDNKPANHKPDNHFTLLQKMVGQFPECLSTIQNVINQDISGFLEEIDSLCEFEILDERYKLSNKRADFIKRIIEYRLQHAKELFGT